MKQEEFKKLTGLYKVPVYWDRRYTRAILKISNNQHSETRRHNRYWRHN